MILIGNTVLNLLLDGPMIDLESIFTYRALVY